ncbi:class IIb bacteriocin, lactobin A/cerein 7B family [Natroniella sp. ANB-PHB2]|uniref:class IIb bacteriocin, lactobin A/cerein 7B family n=1 Tax=Natroniella sp. ANB-PHB2 TaxID=3384444 RepID=UPI0038D3BD2F
MRELNEQELMAVDGGWTNAREGAIGGGAGNAVRNAAGAAKSAFKAASSAKLELLQGLKVLL